MELGAFLRSRRAALTPAQVGLPPALTTRRVPGLRREEVAILAGVSVDYYVKLEQGRAGNVSEQVIEAIERALRLDDLERAHLRSLLRPGSAFTARPVAVLTKARPALLNMIHAMETVPAVIHGPHLEVLGINQLGKVLLDDFDAMPPAERNMARWMFLNPRARVVYRDWARIAAQMTAVLRAAPAGETLTTIVRGLSARSPEFARCWADYQLYEHTAGVKLFFHEAVGDLRINYQTLQLPDSLGQTVIVYSADPGSPSAEKLRLLGSWMADAAVR